MDVGALRQAKPDRIATKRYPQALAVALALRHSWQRHDFVTFSKRLDVKVTSKDLPDTPPASIADPHPRSPPPSQPHVDDPGRELSAETETEGGLAWTDAASRRVRWAVPPAFR
jgi:hypothetical protein